MKLRKLGTVDMLTGSVTRNFRHFLVIQFRTNIK